MKMVPDDGDTQCGVFRELDLDLVGKHGDPAFWIRQFLNRRKTRSREFRVNVIDIFHRKPEVVNCRAFGTFRRFSASKNDVDAGKSQHFQRAGMRRDCTEQSP